MGSSVGRLDDDLFPDQLTVGLVDWDAQKPGSFAVLGNRKPFQQSWEGALNGLQPDAQTASTFGRLGSSVNVFRLAKIF